MMKILFTILLALTITTQSLDINIAGDIFAQLTSDFVGDVNLGNSIALLFTDVISLSASSTVEGLLTLGSQGLFASTPNLEIETGAVFNVSSFILNGGNIIGAGELFISGEADFNADSEVSATFTAGSVIIGSIVDASNSFIVQGTAAIEAGAAFTADVGATAEFHGDVTGTGSIAAYGNIEFAADASASINVATAVAVAVTGQISVVGEAVFAGVIDAQGGIIVTAEAAMEISSDSSCSAGGAISLEGDTSSLTATGSFDVGCDVSGFGSLEFNAATAVQSQITATDVAVDVLVSGSSQVTASATSSFESNVVVSGSGSFEVSGSGTVSGNLEINGNGAVSVSGTGSLSVQGSASFEATAEYHVHATTASSTNYIQVTGEATLGGDVVLTTDVEFEADTEIVIMTYGSRASASTFASVSVTAGSSKRALHQDDYEVVYEDDRAIVRHASGDDNSSSVSLVVSMIIALLCVLF